MTSRFPERRRHTRIITLRNFAWLTLASVLLLAAINVMSELRAPHANDYGRLLNKQIQPSPEVSTHSAEVAPVEEGASVGSDAVVGDNVATPASSASAEPQRLDASAWQAGTPATPLTASDGSAKIAIVGDESGIAVVTPKHKLRGGWFRQ